MLFTVYSQFFVSLPVYLFCVFSLSFSLNHGFSEASLWLQPRRKRSDPFQCLCHVASL
jgi:hypothetical protein